MPQKTNLNISPYYDDFDKADNFYKVLFKPGFPVQARELTSLQSILQNQVESFGSHIFKEGSMVIPGGVTYDSTYFSVKVNPDHLGIDETKVTEESSFIDDLGADSLDTVELVMALEEEFGSEISDSEAEKILTVGDAVKFIEGKRN